MSRSQPRDVLLQLPDRRIRARWLAPSAGPPADPYAPTLVFLHEGLGCVELWRSFPEALCARAGLSGLAYDRTGYGQSSAWPLPPGGRYLETESSVVLPQVLDAAGIEACVLIGHGDGGTIALHFAATQPPLLRAVVTIGAHAVTEPRTLSSIRQAREAFLTSDLRAQLACYHGDNVDGAFWIWNDAWLAPGFEPIDADESLPRVRVPVLALQGEYDEYGTVAQLHAISRGVSGRCETRRMTGCGHGPHLQDEPTLVEVVARFIATLWRGPEGRPSRGARALLLALACMAFTKGTAEAQADPCAGESVHAVLAGSRRDMDSADDGAAAQRLREAAESLGTCPEIGLAALAVDGWVETRRLALAGGAPGELARIRDTLMRIETVRAARPPTALLAQLAAYADAVLRSAVAAAQEERDEMQVYLAHARTLAESLALAGIDRPWPLPIGLVEGELWLEVDRFTEAQEALARVTDDRLAGRVALTLGQALERLDEQAAACAAYRRAATASLAPGAAERARLAVIRLNCPPG